MQLLSITPEEKHELLKTARDAISSRLGGKSPQRQAPPAGSALAIPCGAFVTLRKHGELRGCIGHITASKPLLETVRDMAVAAAFEDPRFPSLTSGELPEISIEISALSPFTRITDPAEIRVGEHGIMMRLGHRSGLLLPQVAVEQGWDRDTFLTHTCFKAGLPADAWKTGSAEIEIFSAVIFNETDEN
jgi:AmmeMemoRadiSam system protein A